MAGLALLVGIVGAVGSALIFTGVVPALVNLAVPPALWPVLAVAGFVVFFVTRRPAD